MESVAETKKTLTLSVLFRLLEYFLDNVACPAAVGFDYPVGDLAVQGVAYIHQFAEFSARVAGLQQGPVTVVSGTLELLFYRCVQVNNSATGGQVLPVKRVKYGATTSRKDDMLACCEVINDFVFAFAETRFSLEFEDQRDVYAGAILDFPVTVDELKL